MQKMFKVTKYTGQPGTDDHTVLDSREALTWDDASKVAIELGALPGTGAVDELAFETVRSGVWVSIETVKP